MSHRTSKRHIPTSMDMSVFSRFKINLTLVFLVTGMCSESFSQNIHRVEYVNQSDLKVFEVDYPNQSDLQVYVVDYANQITDNNDGL